MTSLQPFLVGELKELADWVRRYYSFDGLEFGDRTVDGLRELLDNPSYGIAWRILDDGRMAGYAVLTYGFDHEAGGRCAVLCDFFLDEAYRRRGIGPHALTLIREHCASVGVKQLELFVLKRNDTARAVYERAGFKMPPDRDFLYLSVSDVL